VDPDSILVCSDEALVLVEYRIESECVCTLSQHLLGQRGFKGLDNGVGERLLVTHVDQSTVLTALEDLVRSARAISRDDGTPARQRLDEDRRQSSWREESMNTDASAM